MASALDNLRRAFFARHSAAREEAVQPGNGDDQVGSGQHLAQFIKRDVLGSFSAQDLCS